MFCLPPGCARRGQHSLRKANWKKELTDRIMHINSYAEEFIVAEYECDAAGHMTPGAILRHAQQVATNQCTLLGLTEEAYRRTHTAFLLAKTALEVHAPIRVGTKIRIETHPCAAQRAVYLRHTALYGPGGETLCDIDSRWVLVDTGTKRILRRPPEGLPMPFTPQDVPQLDHTLLKGAAEPDGTETASYTRCDKNRHLNNTFYADIVCDHVPLSQMTALTPVRLAIVYHSEVPMGTNFTMLRAQTAENRWYFCGAGEEKKHFEADLTLG